MDRDEQPQLSAQMLLQRLEQRLGRQPSATHQARLRHELTLIQSHEDAAILEGMARVATAIRSADLRAAFVGNAPSSLIAFALRTHDLDPLEHGLHAESFFRPGRGILLPANLYVADGDYEAVSEIIAQVRPGVDPDTWVSRVMWEDGTMPRAGQSAIATPDVWARFATGEVEGVRHLDKPEFRDIHRDFAPASLEELALLNAVWRPGHIRAGHLDALMRGRHGEPTTPTLHTDLDQAVASELGPTYGVLIFDEQWLSLVTTLAGVDVGAAMELRRSLQKRTRERFDSVMQEIREGLDRTGRSPSAAEALGPYLAQAVDPAFPKAHVLADARLTLQTAVSTSAADA